MCAKRYILIIAVLVGVGFAHPASASISDDIAAKQRQIEELQRQIDLYQAQAQQVGAQKHTLQNEIAKLNAQVSQISAQINQLNASIDQTGLEIDETTDSITEAERKVGIHQDALGEYLRATYASDQKSLSEIVLQNDAFSEFFDYIHQIQLTQTNLRQTITDIRGLREQLDDQRDTLKGKQGELEQMRALTEVQRRDLASAKGAKNSVLKTTQGQEAKYQQLIQTSKRDLERLKEQIYYLQQSGITVQDAVKYAELAAIGAGIRPAFLLALLEVESRLGLNVGSGNWRDDMYLCYVRLAALYPTKKDHYLNRAETEKNAYMTIVNSLGINPDSVKVSREPTYGCGGAMGPAQFIPSTWLGYASAVTALTKRAVANPWNTEDAFTASAIKLSRGGAASKTPAGEIAAAKAYISGNPNCVQAVCNSYANTIQQKAAAIAQNL